MERLPNGRNADTSPVRQLVSFIPYINYTISRSGINQIHLRLFSGANFPQTRVGGLILPITMLRELHILNFAVIADLKVEFDPGLNCFTGQTGAGKSLVIGALEVLLGLSQPQDMLRY